MARHRKLSDVKAQNVPFFSQPTSSFHKAFPTVKTIGVEVRSDGEGFEPLHNQTEWLAVYTESNIPGTIDCRNPRCTDGGLDLERLIRWSVVEGKQASYETTKKCEGHEGSPKGQRKGEPCETYFKVKVSVTYREGEGARD